MRVALIHDCQLPVHGYGGTERLLWWLSKEFAKRGHEAILCVRSGSSAPHAVVVPVDFSKRLSPQLPAADIYHWFFTPPFEPEHPYVVTIGGNGKAGEVFLRNTVFVSRNHAERHGSTAYVYNGVDPDDYVFREKKKDQLLFLAKASWSVKNVRGAIRISRRSHLPLKIVGGSRRLFPKWRGQEWMGTLGGAAKAEVIANSSALVFPVLWDEPFGIAVVEALVSGTPVLATPFGSLPEIVDPEVGRLCHSEAEFVETVRHLGVYKPWQCRDYALERFSAASMAEKYLGVYEKVGRGGILNSTAPRSTAKSSLTYTLPK